MITRSPNEFEKSKAQSPDLIDEIKAGLVAILGDRISDEEAIRRHHSKDEAYHTAMPHLVAFPNSASEVSSIVSLCNEFRFPLIPWGAGSSLEGNAVPVQGGLCLDMSNMNRILRIDADDHTATVEAGVRRKQLNHELRHTGLQFPIDPGADATLGGMAATRASGTNAVKYGTMRENVLYATVVSADGSIMKTRSRAPKSSAGYDLTGLLVGSEGTLGVITDLALKLYPIPDSIITLVCTFDSIPSAIEVVISAMHYDVSFSRVEFLDGSMMAAIAVFQKQAFSALPTLMVEFAGHKASTQHARDQFSEILCSAGGEIISSADTQEERSILWKIRHNALYAAINLAPGKRALITDVCIPLSSLSDCIVETRKDLDNSRFEAMIVGHVGDGNFHTFILIDPKSNEDILEAEALHKKIAERAIAMDGTCTGEHGIGIGKRELLIKELGKSVSLMRTIKDALDPHGIFNPGKLFM